MEVRSTQRSHDDNTPTLRCLHSVLPSRSRKTVVHALQSFQPCSLPVLYPNSMDRIRGMGLSAANNSTVTCLISHSRVKPDTSQFQRLSLCSNISMTRYLFPISDPFSFSRGPKFGPVHHGFLETRSLFRTQQPSLLLYEVINFAPAPLNVWERPESLSLRDDTLCMFSRCIA